MRKAESFLPAQIGDKVKVFDKQDIIDYIQQAQEDAVKEACDEMRASYIGPPNYKTFYEISYEIEDELTKKIRNNDT